VPVATQAWSLPSEFSRGRDQTHGVAIATPKQAQNGAALGNGNGATGDSTITIVYRDNVTDIPGELLQAFINLIT
jgi:hypothetical protein